MLKIDVRKGLLVAAALLVALPAHSAEPEIWTMTTPQGSCRLSFEEDPVAEGVLSTLFHDGSCFDFTNPVTGYSMNNGDHTIILYSTKDGLTMVGRADLEEPGHYVGVIGDGEQLTLVQDGGKPAPRPQAPARPMSTAAVLSRAMSAPRTSPPASIRSRRSPA
jgi:hypothetical protein